MNIAQNLEGQHSPPLKQQQFLQNQNQETSIYDQIYDDEFVSLINGLNESIKEYYKVSRNNITEANSFILYYEHQGIAIQKLMDEIINNNSYERINEFFEQIPKINEIMAQLQLNANSNEKNLNLFFEDAKILFKKMKMKRKQKVMELNSYKNNNMNKSNQNNLNDSFSNSYNYNQTNKIKNNIMANNNNINNNLKKPQASFRRVNNTNNINSQQNKSILMSINNIYSHIIQLLNDFSEFNFMISKINFDSSNKFSNLQNNIKLELDKLINLVKNTLNNKKNTNKVLHQNKSYNNFNEETNKRSQSIPSGVNREIEGLKKIIQNKEKKIFSLNNQLNSLRQKINNYNIGFNSDNDSKLRELEINNNNLNLKLMQAEQLIKEKDNLILNYQSNSNNINNNNLINNSLNMNNILKQKEAQILNLQQQLYVYQKNEVLLNKEINDLNNKVQTKINQSESQVPFMNNKQTNQSLSQIISNKNNEILKLQNENNKNKKEIEKLKMIINSQGNQNMQNNPTEEYEQIIEVLKNDINNYQNLVNQYKDQIRELSQNNSNGINMNNNMNNNQILNKNALNEQRINQINSKNNKIIEELKMKISQLNKEIINYQRKEKAIEENNNKYIKQIEEMNNNILYTNKIIEQKDDLIKQLNERKNDSVDINNNNLQLQKERDDYKFQFEQMQKKYINLKELLENNNINNENNNDNNNIKIKLMDIQEENEKLKKQIEDLTNINNNNLLLKDKITNGNDFQQNNDLMAKVKELTLENKKYQDSLASTKELISKLESDITKKNDELEGLKTFIFKLQSQLEKQEDNKAKKDESRKNSSINVRNNNENICITEPNRKDKNKKNNDHNKSFEVPKDSNTAMINNILSKLNDAEKKITTLQNKNKELQFQLDEKQVEKEISGYRTEDVNFSNYEEEFDLKKMVNGARDKNRSEDINIDYPGVQGIKDKYKELLQNMNILEEQVKILISNINCNNKIKPQITQICQLMRIPPKNIQMIIAGKDKKKALGLVV